MIITSSMLEIFMEPSAGILLGFINSRLRNCARPYLDILASHLSCGSRRLGVNNFKHLWRPFLWLNLQYLRVTPQFLLIELQFWRLTFWFLLVFKGSAIAAMAARWRKCEARWSFSWRRSRVSAGRAGGWWTGASSQVMLHILFKVAEKKRADMIISAAWWEF